MLTLLPAQQSKHSRLAGELGLQRLGAAVARRVKSRFGRLRSRTQLSGLVPPCRLRRKLSTKL